MVAISINFDTARGNQQDVRGDLDQITGMASTMPTSTLFYKYQKERKTGFLITVS
jgi:hypothetical protein